MKLKDWERLCKRSKQQQETPLVLCHGGSLLRTGAARN